MHLALNSKRKKTPSVTHLRVSPNIEPILCSPLPCVGGAEGCAAANVLLLCCETISRNLYNPKLQVGMWFSIVWLLLPPTLRVSRMPCVQGELTQLKPAPLAGKEEPKDGGDGAYDTLGCVTQRIKGQLSCSKSEIPSPASSVRDIIDALV